MEEEKKREVRERVRGEGAAAERMAAVAWNLTAMGASIMIMMYYY